MPVVRNLPKNSRPCPISGCTPGGSKVAAQIAEILGLEVPEEQERFVAQLKCLGDCNNVKAKHIYHGVKDCKAAIALSGGPTPAALAVLVWATASKFALLTPLRWVKTDCRLLMLICASAVVTVSVNVHARLLRWSVRQ